MHAAMSSSEPSSNLPAFPPSCSMSLASTRKRTALRQIGICTQLTAVEKLELIDELWTSIGSEEFQFQGT